MLAPYDLPVQLLGAYDVRWRGNFGSYSFHVMHMRLDDLAVVGDSQKHFGKLPILV